MSSDVSSCVAVNTALYKDKPFKVMVCAVTLMAFFINIFAYELVWAAPVVNSDQVRLTSTTDANPVRLDNELTGFAIPEYLGHIKDSYFTPNSQLPTPNSKLIIHIQDAHCNYAAQNTISNIIDYLNREYGVNTVNLEGGEENYDLSPFYSIKDADLREKTADYFLREGEISAAEFYAINNPDKISLWGVENTDLYLKNLNVYRDSIKDKDIIDKYLKELDYALNNLKAKVYSKELFLLSQKASNFKDKAIDLKDYASYLAGYAKNKNIDLVKFKNLMILTKVFSLERGLDFKKANAERDQLIDKLNKSLSKNEIKELVEKAVSFKFNHIQPVEFYSYLTSKAKEVDISLSGYRNLNLYIEYIDLYAALKNEELFKDIETIESKIKDTIYSNENEKELEKLCKNFYIIKSALNITLTEDEFRYYQEHKADFVLDNFIKFIKKESSKYELKIALGSGLSGLDAYLKDIEKFYSLSFKRDEEFIKHIKFSSNKLPTPNSKLKTTILITGGFHTENLTKLFRQKGVSYVSIMPNFALNDKECPYFKLLAGKESVFNKYARTGASTLAYYTHFSKNAPRIHGEEDVLGCVTGIAGALRNGSVQPTEPLETTTVVGQIKPEISQDRPSATSIIITAMHNFIVKNKALLARVRGRGLNGKEKEITSALLSTYNDILDLNMDEEAMNNIVEKKIRIKIGVDSFKLGFYTEFLVNVAAVLFQLPALLYLGYSIFCFIAVYILSVTIGSVIMEYHQLNNVIDNVFGGEFGYSPILNKSLIGINQNILSDSESYKGTERYAFIIAHELAHILDLPRHYCLAEAYSIAGAEAAMRVRINYSEKSAVIARIANEVIDDPAKRLAAIKRITFNIRSKSDLSRELPLEDDGSIDEKKLARRLKKEAESGLKDDDYMLPEKSREAYLFASTVGQLALMVHDTPEEAVRYIYRLGQTGDFRKADTLKENLRSAMPSHNASFFALSRKKLPRIFMRSVTPLLVKVLAATFILALKNTRRAKATSTLGAIRIFFTEWLRAIAAPLQSYKTVVKTRNITLNADENQKVIPRTKIKQTMDLYVTSRDSLKEQPIEDERIQSLAADTASAVSYPRNSPAISRLNRFRVINSIKSAEVNGPEGKVVFYECGESGIVAISDMQENEYLLTDRIWSCVGFAFRAKTPVGNVHGIGHLFCAVNRLDVLRIQASQIADKLPNDAQELEIVFYYERDNEKEAVINKLKEDLRRKFPFVNIATDVYGEDSAAAMFISSKGWGVYKGYFERAKDQKKVTGLWSNYEIPDTSAIAKYSMLSNKEKADLLHDSRKPLITIFSVFEMLMGTEKAKEILGEIPDFKPKTSGEKMSSSLYKCNEFLSKAMAILERIEPDPLASNTSLADYIDVLRAMFIEAKEMLDNPRDNEAQFNLRELIFEEKVRLEMEFTDLELVLAGGNIDVVAYKQRFRRMLRNLLRNAAEALSGTAGIIDKQIVVYAFKDELTGELKIMVADNGKGIDPKNAEKIFERFYTSEKKDGTGIGLSSATEFVGKDLSGKIRLLSGHQPTMFAINLPYKTTEDSNALRLGALEYQALANIDHLEYPPFYYETNAHLNSILQRGGLKRILFVCTNNILRSPQMQESIDKLLAEEGIGGIESVSQGTFLLEGGTIYDGNGNPVTEEEMMKADLVVVPEFKHKVILMARYMRNAHKIFLLTELLGKDHPAYMMNINDGRRLGRGKKSNFMEDENDPFKIPRLEDMLRIGILSRIMYARSKAAKKESAGTPSLIRLDRRAVIDLLGNIWDELKLLDDNSDFREAYGRYDPKNTEESIVSVKVSMPEMLRSLVNKNLRVDVRAGLNDASFSVLYKDMPLVHIHLLKRTNELVELCNVWISPLLRSEKWGKRRIGQRLLGTRINKNIFEYLKHIGFREIKIEPKDVSDGAVAYWKQFGVGYETPEEPGLVLKLDIDELINRIDVLISGSGQIGKEAVMVEDTIKLSEDKKRGSVRVKNSNTGEYLTTLYFNEAERDILNDAKAEMDIAELAGNHYSEIIRTFIGLLEKSPPRFYFFSNLAKDLFAFVSPQNNMIALHKELFMRANISLVTVFHEIGEYLIKAGILRLELSADKRTLYIHIKDDKRIVSILVSDGIDEKLLKDEQHYLLRTLQKEIFKKEDPQLTDAIREIKDRRRINTETEIVRVLKEKIAQKGKITFEEFMTVALYYHNGRSEESGYYSGGKLKIGSLDKDESRAGHFMTFPEHVPEAFGEGIAKKLIEMWKSMGKPSRFQVVEMGAGNGVMADNVLAYVKKAHRQFFNAIDYKIVEISPALADRQRKLLQNKGYPVSWILGSAVNVSLKNVEGVFISNELPDAFPVHRVRNIDGELKELYVVYRDGEFYEEWGDISTPEIYDYIEMAKTARQEHNSEIDYLLNNMELVINLNAIKWQQSISNNLKKGYVITIDYGVGKIDATYTDSAYEPAFRVYGLNGAQYLEDMYSRPGEIDMTSDVDLILLAERGQSFGLKSEGIVPQLDFFSKLGMDEKSLKELDRVEKMYVLVQSKLGGDISKPVYAEMEISNETAARHLPDELKALVNCIKTFKGHKFYLTGGTATYFAIAVNEGGAERKFELPVLADVDVAIITPGHETKVGEMETRLYQRLENKFKRELRVSLGYSEEQVSVRTLDAMPGLALGAADYVFEHVLLSGDGDAFSINRLAVDITKDGYTIFGTEAALDDLKNKRLHILNEILSKECTAKLLGKAALFLEKGFTFDQQSKKIIENSIKNIDKTEGHSFIGWIHAYLMTVDNADIMPRLNAIFGIFGDSITGHFGISKEELLGDEKNKTLAGPAAAFAHKKEGYAGFTKASQAMTLDEAREFLRSYQQTMFIDDLELSYKFVKAIEEEPSIQKVIVAGAGLRSVPLLLALTGHEVVFVDESMMVITVMKEHLLPAIRNGLKDKNINDYISIDAVCCNIQNLDLESLDSGPGSFDLVTFVDLVGGIPSGSPKSWLLKAREALKPTGYLVIDEEDKARESIMTHFSSIFPNHTLLNSGVKLKGAYNETETNGFYKVINRPKTPPLCDHGFMQIDYPDSVIPSQPFVEEGVLFVPNFSAIPISIKNEEFIDRLNKRIGEITDTEGLIQKVNKLRGLYGMSLLASREDDYAEIDKKIADIILEEPVTRDILKEGILSNLPEKDKHNIDIYMDAIETGQISVLEFDIRNVVYNAILNDAKIWRHDGVEQFMSFPQYITFIQLAQGAYFDGVQLEKFYVEILRNDKFIKTGGDADAWGYYDEESKKFYINGDKAVNLSVVMSLFLHEIAHQVSFMVADTLYEKEKKEPDAERNLIAEGIAVDFTIYMFDLLAKIYPNRMNTQIDHGFDLLSAWMRVRASKYTKPYYTAGYALVNTMRSFQADQDHWRSILYDLCIALRHPSLRIRHLTSPDRLSVERKIILPSGSSESVTKPVISWLALGEKYPMLWVSGDESFVAAVESSMNRLGSFNDFSLSALDNFMKEIENAVAIIQDYFGDTLYSGVSLHDINSPFVAMIHMLPNGDGNILLNLNKQVNIGLIRAYGDIVALHELIHLVIYRRILQLRNNMVVADQLIGLGLDPNAYLVPPERLLIGSLENGLELPGFEPIRFSPGDIGLSYGYEDLSSALQELAVERISDILLQHSVKYQASVSEKMMSAIAVEQGSIETIARCVIFEETTGIDSQIELKDKWEYIDSKIPPEDARRIKEIFKEFYRSIKPVDAHLHQARIGPGASVIWEAAQNLLDEGLKNNDKSKIQAALGEAERLISQFQPDSMAYGELQRITLQAKTVLGLNSLAERELQYGMVPGNLPNRVSPFYRILRSILTAEGMMSHDVIERLAQTIARMRPGSIEIMHITGVITNEEKDIFVNKDANGLNALTGQEKHRLWLRLKQLMDSYDKELTDIQKYNMSKRLIPIYVLNFLTRQFNISRSSLLLTIKTHPDFPIWLPRAKSRVEEIKDRVGGYTNAWNIVIAQGVDNVNEWVARAERKVESIKDKVYGRGIAWVIVMEQGLEELDDWLAKAEKKVDEMKDVIPDRSSAWHVIVNQGLKKVDAWLVRAVEKVNSIKDKVGNSSTAWDIVIGHKIENVDDWVKSALPIVASIKDRVGGSANAWRIVMGQGPKNTEDWVSRASEIVRNIEGEVGGSANAWRIIIGQGPNNALDWKTKAASEVNKIKDKVVSTTNAWSVVINQGIEKTDEWVLAASVKVDSIKDMVGTITNAWLIVIGQGLEGTDKYISVMNPYVERLIEHSGYSKAMAWNQIITKGSLNLAPQMGPGASVIWEAAQNLLDEGIRDNDKEKLAAAIEEAERLISQFQPDSMAYGELQRIKQEASLTLTKVPQADQGMTTGKQVMESERRRMRELEYGIGRIAKEHIPLTESIIKTTNALVRWHFEVGIGEYRIEDIYVTGSGEKFPKPEEISGKMNEFVTWFNAPERSRQDQIEYAAEAAFRLVKIHPFNDGNGRTAISIMNIVLRRNGLPDFKHEPKDRPGYLGSFNRLDEFVSFVRREAGVVPAVAKKMASEREIGLAKLAAEKMIEEMGGWVSTREYPAPSYVTGNSTMHDIAAVLAGRKPAAICGKTDTTKSAIFRIMVEKARQGGFAVEQISKAYVIGVPSNVKRIALLLNEASRSNGPIDEDYHREIGRSLGYNEDAIKDFIKKDEDIIKHSATELLDTVRFPGEERIFFIPVSDISTFNSIYQNIGSEIKHSLDGFNISIIFYDGTEKGLTETYEKAASRLTKPGVLALAYVFEGKYEMAEKIFGKNNPQVKWIQERIPEGANIEVGPHVVLGLGILDYVRNNRRESHDYRALLDFIEKVGGVITADPGDIEKLKKGDVDILFSPGFVFLPRIKKADINKIGDWKKHELEFAHSA